VIDIWDILAIVWITEIIISGIWKLYELRRKKEKQVATSKRKGVINYE